MTFTKNTISRLAGFGEIMMRLHCPDGQRFQNTPRFDVYYGGGEANVCVLLSGLGFPVKYITRLPSNDLGSAVKAQLRSYGVDTSGIAEGGDKLGLYFTENGNLLRNSKVIYDRKNSSFASLEPGMINWNEVLDSVDCFHWSGISPALSASTAAVCREALDVCKSKGILVSTDLNYRSTLWNWGKSPAEVMPDLLAFSDIIIGDLNAASLYLDDEQLHKIASQAKGNIEEQFSLCSTTMKKHLPSMKMLAMSFRGTSSAEVPTYRGALMVDEDCCYSKEYAIPQVIDRIGSGDAFTGGLLYAAFKGYEPADAIAFATAAGILKHSMAGDFTILSEAEIDYFIQHGHSSRINR